MEKHKKAKWKGKCGFVKDHFRKKYGDPLY